ncbi:GYF domain-containing protein [Sporobolomyces koalae]|uniref:GYF domain-containing protein n=1 Tax=Sporobolomyces koalae TaxID=500713 RepID=UPI003170C064
MSFGGPGSAFSFAAPPRPARRTGSYSGSVGSTGVNGNGGNSSSSTATSPSTLNGPAPVNPPANPSHGSWSNSATASPRQREDSNPSSNGDLAPRSFSSILSPSLAANGAHANGEDGVLGGAGGFSGGKTKPFVYSRDFLLSLYDDDKAKKRPLELAVHEMATRDLSTSEASEYKPWALQEYREGEKDLFATTIHPANARPSRMNRTDSSLSNSNGANGTLDLSTLGALPRDRDRALGSPSLRSPSIPGAEAGLGRERRTRERSTGPGSMGIMGGVLGGIAPVASPVLRKKDGEASKEVWQGGRWRRGQAQETEESIEKRPSAFGSRRFPLPEDGKVEDKEHDRVPDAWDQDKHDSQNNDPAQLNGSSLNSPTGSLSAEADLTASVLGSLALDSDPLEDSLLSNKPVFASGTSTPARAAPPPGLSALPPPAEVNWQYRDPSGQVQGPFSATMMHDWYRQQFFQPDLRVKRTSDLDFETLAELIRRTGDSEKPFLAPKPSYLGTAPGSAFSSAPGTPQLSSAWGASRAQTPLEQFTGSIGQARFAGANGASASYYEPFGSNVASPSVQSQSIPQLLGARAVNTPGGTALDPWGSPVVAAGSPALQQLFVQQQLQQQQQQQQQQYATQSPLVQHGIPSSVDVLRQLQQQHQQQAQSPSFAPQYAGHLPGADVFGRPSPLQAPSYFDPRQLAHGSPAQQPAPTAWIGQQVPQQPQQLQQQQQQPQQFQQQPWSNIGSPAQQPAQPAATPIGPPAPVAVETAPVETKEPEVQAVETVVVESVPEKKEPEVPTVVEEVTVVEPVIIEQPVVAPTSAAAKKSAAKEAKEAKAAAAAAAAAATAAAVAREASPAPEPEQSLPASPSVAPSVESDSTNAKAPAIAPWAKDETVSPGSGSGAAASPSLREIQQAEAREADKRKAAQRVQAAQANIQAAQRAAAAEAALAAEQLPSSANWAAGPAQVPAVKPSASAPWTKPATPTSTKSTGKTLKEIQEEEERRKKAQVAAQQQTQSGVSSFAGKGYAATATKGNPSAPWTTVAVKPAVVHTAAATKSIIPGLPSAGSVVVQPSARPAVPTSTASFSSKTSATPVAVRPSAVSTPSGSALVTKPSVIRSINVNGASSTPSAQVYDAENPPPPSSEFLAWIRQALKGLQVPMEEFIQVLLSFPLDASSDVLEIISDSVYANSSTLDGRRFANDYAARRKNDVAVRYPQIFAKGKVVASSKTPAVSMAQALAQPQTGKPAEWSVKVSGGKKKKGSK